MSDVGASERRNGRRKGILQKGILQVVFDQAWSAGGAVAGVGGKPGVVCAAARQLIVAGIACRIACRNCK